MLAEVPAASREALRPLFADCPGWHGVIEAVLSGAMGHAFADNLDSPSVALLKLGFDHFPAGRPDSNCIGTVMRALPPSCFLVVPESWNEPLERDYGDFLSPTGRASFGSAPSDRWKLRSFLDGLPADFNLQRITAANVGRFAALDDSFVRNYGTHERFLSEGIGFGIEYAGRFVSGSSSYASGGGKLEMEVDTHPDFRRQGLASASAAAVILDCLENGIEPCWDAANEASARLAAKLGFSKAHPYTAYMVHPVPAS